MIEEVSWTLPFVPLDFPIGILIYMHICMNASWCRTPIGVILHSNNRFVVLRLVLLPHLPPLAIIRHPSSSGHGPFMTPAEGSPRYWHISFRL